MINFFQQRSSISCHIHSWRTNLLIDQSGVIGSPTQVNTPKKKWKACALKKQKWSVDVRDYTAWGVQNKIKNPA